MALQISHLNLALFSRVLHGGNFYHVFVHFIANTVSCILAPLDTLSVIWGSLLLLICDTITGTAFASFELSAGIVISIIGAPTFIWMLINRKVG